MFFFILSKIVKLRREGREDLACHYPRGSLEGLGTHDMFDIHRRHTRKATRDGDETETRQEWIQKKELARRPSSTTLAVLNGQHHRPPTTHKNHSTSSSPSGSAAADHSAGNRLQTNRRLANPLAGRGRTELAAMGEEYCRRWVGLATHEDVRAFRLGAAIAGGSDELAGFEDVVEGGLTAREREVLAREVTDKWSNPGMLYWVIASGFFFCARSLYD